jgi:processive 1,2-diacylglycerol beta-glucosyltransferase
LIKERERLDVPLVGVVTDYYSHYYWPVNRMDKYVVATKEAKKEFVLRGIDKAKIEVLGIPISLKFIEKKNKKELMKKLRLKQKPTILVMGGGLGIGYIKKVVKLLDSLDNVQIIAVCGKNEKLKTKLLKRKFNNPVIIKGHVGNMDELMQVSDLAVTKAGGLTVSECLAKNLAMVLLRPLPGQEERNADYLVKNKLAVKIKNEKYLMESVKKQLNKKADLREFAKPDAVIKIAKLIQRLIKGSRR